MAREYIPVDISNAPDLKRLAEAVRQTGKPHALKEGAETVAVVRPVSKRERSNRSPRQPSTARGHTASPMDNPALAKQLEDDLRANREAPVDRAALFAPPSPEELERRKALYDEIQAHRHQRVIAPLTASDLIHIARAQEEEGMAQAADELVLDASIGIKWHLADEEHSDLAQNLLRQYRTGEVGLVAPTHLHYEVFNALMVASRLRRPRLAPQDAIAATDEFLRLAIPTVTDDALLRAARALAYRWGCAFYDGLYVALAERLHLRLITADRKLYTLVATHPLVLWITDYFKA